MTWTERLEKRKTTVFREPEGGKEVWISVGVGTIIIVLSLSGRFGGPESALFYLFIGLFLWTSAAAEVLPKTRTRIAGILRISSLLLLILLGVFVLTMAG